MVIVGDMIKLEPATMAALHSLFAMASQAMCKEISDEEQPVLIVTLDFPID